MSTATESGQSEVTDVARRYFDAVGRRDVEAMVACWEPGNVDRLVGDRDLPVPVGVREYFGELFGAFPDLEFTVLSTATEGEVCSVRWRLRGTFAGPGTLEGLEPNGARLDLEGCDVVQVRGGLIHHNDAYFNGAAMVRQLGVMPPAGSATEQRMTALMNGRTRVGRRLGAAEPERIADGVWVVRGGIPQTMNVYLLEDDGGVTVFDAGIETMTKSVAAAGARLGGIKRVVLGHAHADHRGVAPGLGVPVFCHHADRADAEGDGGEHYFDFSKLDKPARWLMPRMLRFWDGGAVPIAGTVEEGEELAGFRVVHLPGHAPGLIGLWRESDRLALASDCFYTLDPQTGRKGHPRVPHAAFNQDTEQARESIRKLAALEPATAWAGHAEPLRGDVRSQLEQAAATT